MAARDIREFCWVGEHGRRAAADGNYTAGAERAGLYRILKIARTIVDLDAAEEIGTAHVSEAIQYRSLDRLLKG